MDIREPSMENEYVKAKKGVLVDCLTCPLCSNLLREATTISVCLHTFCKECIYQIFEHDGTCCCPICNVYLGISPHEKLRPDNNLQALRMNIFPTDKSPEAPEALATQTNSTRIKKKSLSSLIIDANTGLKELSLDNAEDVPKKAGKSGGVISKSKVSRDVDGEDDDPDWTYSRRRSKKHFRASKRKGKNKDKAVILDLNVPASIPDLEKQSPATASETRPVSILESKNSTAATTSENKCPDEVYTRVQPIWFCLRASPDHGEDALPQISTSYIRMKDGNVPISTIKKYLLKKLNMTDESEVEIMCGGQTLAPSAPLNSLVDIWIQFVVKTEGLSALQLNTKNRNSKDHKFVMVLTYKKSR